MLPDASGTKPWHFTLLIAAIGLLATLLVVERTTNWASYLVDDPAKSVAPALMSLKVGGTLMRVPQDYVVKRPFGSLLQGSKSDLKKLRLAMSWPGLEAIGESAEVGSEHKLSEGIIVADLEHHPGRETLRGQLETFYKRLARGEFTGPNGLKLLSLSDQGSSKTDLIVYDPEKPNGFIARCLQLRALADAICHRAVMLPSGLELRYRFNGRLLTNWRALDRAVIRKIKSFSAGNVRIKKKAGLLRKEAPPKNN